MHLKQPGFTYSTCAPFAKNMERIHKLKKTEGVRYIYQNQLDRARFQHEMGYGEFEDLCRRTAFNKILQYKI